MSVTRELRLSGKKTLLTDLLFTDLASGGVTLYNKYIVYIIILLNVCLPSLFVLHLRQSQLKTVPVLTLPG